MFRRLEVLVDGQARYKATLSQIDWQQLDIAIEDVDRIEITRGPGSVSYGFNAFQGMIHIFTLHPADSSRIALAAHYQSDQGRQGYASLASSREGFDQRLSLWGQRVGEFGGYHDNDNPPDLSQTKAANWQAQLRPDANNRLNVEADRNLNQQEGNSNASIQQDSEVLTNTGDHLMPEWQQENRDSEWQLRSYGIDTPLGNWALTSRYDADTVMYQHNPRWLWQADWRIDW
ncbi:TonB-dependent receptor plug domain-containing protein [Oceanospirillaceae bacterium G-43]|uniref:TonB-dependent receptor plug domain-containing protein n=1 Tax=Parathalassolituus penaei TaxID=2997323 RepID=A0A9X3EFN0_9GAMM|nr:TonB-dependent receptor plug domain-containing protein [Parathalassolituus penaei]MCY0966692.1 TonB-dependent receptor plug domain-containing protein [Parathalassolituus penaei]